MGNEVIPFTTAGGLPAHIAKYNESLSNIPEKLSIPQLSFRGKVWRTVIEGEEKPLVNAEDEPVSTVHVVILNHQKARSRSYYEGNYEEGKSTPPACWSLDGEKPDPSIREPQAETCAKCPKSVKGSKITPNAKETTACSIYKRLAVTPLSNLGFTAMLLRLAQTSMWDKNNDENESKGWYAWDQYLDMLRARGVKHTGLVATKIRFDSRVAYPKLLFAASRWLAEEEIETVAERFESEDVLKLLQASEVAAAARVAEKKDDEEEEASPPKAASKGNGSKPVAAESEDDDPPPPPKGKKAAPAVAASDEDDPPPPPSTKKGNGSKPVAAASAESEDDDPPPPPKGKKAAPKPPADEDEAPPPASTKKGKDDGLGDLVAEWGK